MVSIIKDQKISENSQLIYQHLKDLTNEISRLQNRVKKMDSHFSSAQNDLNDIYNSTHSNKSYYEKSPKNTLAGDINDSFNKVNNSNKFLPSIIPSGLYGFASHIALLTASVSCACKASEGSL